MSTPANKSAGTKAIHPLPLSSTLHDLALLRASDLDLAALLPPGSASTPSSGSTPETEADGAASRAAEEVEASVERSLVFAREARAALRVVQTGGVEREGLRVDALREKLEDVVAGVEDGRAL